MKCPYAEGMESVGMLPKSQRVERACPELQTPFPQGEGYLLPWLGAPTSLIWWGQLPGRVVASLCIPGSCVQRAGNHWHNTLAQTQLWKFSAKLWNVLTYCSLAHAHKHYLLHCLMRGIKFPFWGTHRGLFYCMLVQHVGGISCLWRSWALTAPLQPSHL